MTVLSELGFSPDKCLKEFAKTMEEYPTEESRKNEIERMGQEQINQGKPLLMNTMIQKKMSEK